MRTLRFSAFFVSALLCCAAWSQTAQTVPAQQPSAQTQGKNESQPQPPDATRVPSSSALTERNQQPVDTQHPNNFKLKILPPLDQPKQKKFPTGIVDRGFRAALESGTRKPQVRGIQERSDDFEGRRFRNQLDPGIRIDAGRGNMCGAIVSYNFSASAPGEMPKLESITTCTPTNKVIPQRTRHKENKPRAPTIMQTVLTQ